MGLATTRELTRETYQQLLAHACDAPDFVYLGSPGDGPERGGLTGFSAMAVHALTLPGDGSASIDTVALAAEMESLAAPYQLDRHSEAQTLTGGWIGYLGYELGYARERRLTHLSHGSAAPMMSAGLYLWSASYHRPTGRYWLWIHPQCPAAIHEQLGQWLSSSVNTPSHWNMPRPFTPEQTPDQFRARVQTIKRYIEAGDCYQANLSQAFSGQFSGSPWLAFTALAEANPTPYSAFLNIGDLAVLSVSPERFLEIDRGVVKTSPIKGTRPRGTSPDKDNALADELQASEKDRAENLMIVDLLRNDLSLHAEPGSVTVEQLFALESYANVHHLVSHIKAGLKPGISPLQALFDAFPGGSITGAPKIRAMEIIRELEPHWRGPYCGSVFYYGLNGRLDSNIAIRTLLCESNGTIRCWGGGGIVTDSDPEAEYQETLTKVKPLMDFLEKLKL
ncbi:aminodeoxychorismate synthase component I [Marinobacter sp. VGCF2001]|uniref:aminodeoxychorismate synthase component I n=1 Tax=Marinobacter sp. VGCF2001 TaxID=3417189 RepID=UPI003CEE25B3